MGKDLLVSKDGIQFQNQLEKTLLNTSITEIEFGFYWLTDTFKSSFFNEKNNDTCLILEIAYK